MTEPKDLVERIQCALENPGDCPWLPDLTSDLVKMGWHALYQDAGLSPSNYGTSRVIAKSLLSHRNVAGRLSTLSTVEVLDEGLAAYYQDAGIVFYSAREIADINLVSCVEDGIKLIRCVPGLSATVIALVRTFHLIKPQDDDHDLSFSEPHIPFSIFVSVPTKRSLIHGLRIAEAIVHEAMHLQLTLINQTVPLTRSTSRRYYSPWRKEYRDSQGILHALYVFRVIDRMLEQLASLVGATRDVTEYIRGRRFDIDGQISTIRSFQNCPELTRVGASFVGGLTRHSLE